MRPAVLVMMLLLVSMPAVLSAKNLPARPRRVVVPKTTSESAYSLSRRVRYSFTVQNTGPTLVRDAEVLVFAPVEQTATQRTMAVDATEPFERSTDALGNQTLRFRLTLAPLASKVIGIDARVAFAVEPQPQLLPSKDLFLVSEPYIEVNDPTIQRVAADLGGMRPADTAALMVRWVAEHVADGGYAAERRGAAVALAQRRGDCTESADLLVALARARNIPARTVAGFVVDHDAVLRAADYHNWAELYVDGTWRIADATRPASEQPPSQYVAVRILGTRTAGFSDGWRVSTSRPEIVVRAD